MSTNAAIDRLVYHSTILELNSESYRIKAAKDKGKYLSSESTLKNDSQADAKMEDKNVK